MYNLIICQWFNLVKCVIFQNGKLGGWKINANEFCDFFLDLFVKEIFVLKIYL